jgi:hypothetical protein
MERQGLTPSWARPQLNPMLFERGGDGRVSDAEMGTDPRK